MRTLPTVLVLAAIHSITLFAGTEPTVHIARFAGDRSAAISYTFDDGMSEHYTLAVPMLDEVGLKGTFYVIPGRIPTDSDQSDDKTPRKRMSWDELKKMADNGHEIGNHSWSHPNLTQLPPAQAEEQLTKAFDAISRHIGRPPLTIAFPFNASTPEIQAVALKQHVAFRAYQHGTSEKTTSESLNNWAEQQVRNKTWGVVMIHGIATGYAAFSDPEILRSHLKYVKSRDTDIWVDTFANVARYGMERKEAVLSTKSVSAKKLVITLSSNLPPTVYDVPLTLVVNLSGIKSAQAKRAGQALPIRLTGSSIQLDACPAPAPIVLVWE